MGARARLGPKRLLEAAEAEAQARGFKVMNLSVRETQDVPPSRFTNLSGSSVGARIPSTRSWTANPSPATTTART